VCELAARAAQSRLRPALSTSPAGRADPLGVRRSRVRPWIPRCMAMHWVLSPDSKTSQQVVARDIRIVATPKMLTRHLGVRAFISKPGFAHAMPPLFDRTAPRSLSRTRAETSRQVSGVCVEP